MNNAGLNTKTLSRGLAAGLALGLIVSSVSSCGFIPMGGGTKTNSKVVGEYVPRGKNLNVWFVKEEASNLELTAVSRPKTSNDALTCAVEELLQGPDRADANQGFGTEIPRGTILLGIKKNPGNVEINLSKRFASGGGPTSLETRLQQLARTVKDIEGDVDIFVNIEGERLTASSADGLEIAQPINIQPEFN
ncbi:MAG: GerMN domain-containing protein [Candidatus Melainabacteria bacterium]|nr:GerMN domain-containing protein [Candidatus Melainabacteria bacterium]